MFNFGAKNLGIDLGTANTNVYVEGSGIVIGEPSVIAKDTVTGDVVAVGEEAKNMIGRTPGSIVALRPMKEGVIADFDTTAAMMKYFIDKATGSNNFTKPSVMVCVPGGGTEVESRAIIEATIQAGAKEAFLIEEPFAAAIGAGLPVREPTGSMVIDIGGGTTDVATISLGGIVSGRMIKIGGDHLDDTIIQFIRKKYNLLIGERTAEQVKIEIGSASPEFAEEYGSTEIRGRDMMSGLPKTVEITALDVATAIHDSVKDIVKAVKETLEETSPEISADVIDRGIVITGGGALLKNISDVISNETDVPAIVAEDPLNCVAIGTGKALDHIDLYRNQQQR